MDTPAPLQTPQLNLNLPTVPDVNLAFGSQVESSSGTPPSFYERVIEIVSRYVPERPKAA